MSGRAPRIFQPSSFALAIGLVSSTLLAWGTLDRPPLEWDEVVHVLLAHRLDWTLDDYNTQDSVIERRLPPPIYSSPLYHHPPVVPAMIKVLDLALPGLEAGRLLNLVFWAGGLAFAYSIAARLAGAWAGSIAVALWAACPILNAGARLIHLDLPLTVFFLLGLTLMLHSRGRQSVWLPTLSGLAFALGMLCKFTGPLFVFVPLVAWLAESGRPRLDRRTLGFVAGLGVGFSWWIYVLVRFHSLAPPEFVGSPGRVIEPFTPYLQQLSRREWYHLWIYFLAICPLFVVFLGRLAVEGVRALRRYRHWLDGPIEQRWLLLLALAVVACVATFDWVNAQAYAYWVFRHVMLVFPLIYIVIAAVMARFLLGETRVPRAIGITVLALNLGLMVASTRATVDAGLKVTPIALDWVGLGRIFH